MIVLETILLLVGLLTGLYVWTCRNARRAEAAYPPVGAFITVEGRRLHYLRQGAGPTIVLLHGSEGFLQDFDAVFEPLACHYDVIAFDRPGHGYSDPPPADRCGPGAQAEQIHRALLHLNVSNPILVGHSWSGSLLLAYALLYPRDVAGLTLLGGWMYAPDSPPLWLLRIPGIPLLGPLAVSTLLLPVKGYFLRKNLAEAFAPDGVPADYARRAAALWQRWPGQAQTFARENLVDRPFMRVMSKRYAEIQVPVVLVTGELDRVVPPAQHAVRLHAALPHSNLIVLPNTGHELPQTRPDAVIEAIQRCRNRGQALPTPEGELKCEPRRAAVSERVQVLATQDLPTPFPAGEGPVLTFDAHERARALVMQHGWNAMSYQMLTPEMEHWFAPDESAVIGFVRRSRVRVVAGAPVCPAERLEATVAEFEQAATELGESVCYFGAAERLQAVLSQLPHHDRIAIGAQPVWNPVVWPQMLQKNSSLRGQLNRARNKGETVAEWTHARARNDAGLQRCLDEWMASRLLPPLRFLTAAVPLDRLGDRRVFVAAQQEEPVGFLIATPVPDRNGWLIEQIARGRQAPNGTVELLVDGMMQVVGGEGASYATLGLAPLSKRAGGTTPTTRPWLRLTLDWMRAHGNRFYNFEGLDAFKAKFKPDHWESLYAISNEARFSPRTLYAIAAAFSDGPPLLALSHAVVAALKQELVWQRARFLSGKKSKRR